MNVYLLRQNDYNWDEYVGKVIVAENEKRARDLANDNVGDEGNIWNDPTKVTCEVVSLDNERIVLEDFHAG